ncbi:hypothetical protein [Paraburkholderia sp. J76]|uniref:hypothetical protein n=1 Tax=Paraburkholderia sp. J76 TaxID=2805439 RepID=UPI002ABD3251|nr:hypothetical protein [Paraburkholderia sp. J76]
MTAAHARRIRGRVDARRAESRADAMHFSALVTILAARKGFVPCGRARGSAGLARDRRFLGAGKAKSAKSAKSLLARNKRPGCHV